MSVVRVVGSCLLFAALLFSGSVAGQTPVEIPAAYRFTPDAPLLEGYLVGGSLCSTEGLVIQADPASAPEVIEYPDIDRLENLHLEGKDFLKMTVVLQDGTSFSGLSKLSPGVPMLILQDETASGSEKVRGKPRAFPPEGFRGLAMIEIQAGPTLDFEELTPVAARLLEAVKAQDAEKAMEAYETLKELMGDTEEDEEENEEPAKGAGDPAP
jgi:hypothetical protein